MRHLMVAAIFALLAGSASAQTFYYPDGSAIDGSGRYWSPGGYPVPSYPAYESPAFDGRLPTVDPSGPYSTGRSLPTLRDDDAYGPTSRGYGPPDPPAPYWYDR